MIEALFWSKGNHENDQCLFNMRGNGGEYYVSNALDLKYTRMNHGFMKSAYVCGLRRKVWHLNKDDYLALRPSYVGFECLWEVIDSSKEYDKVNYYEYDFGRFHWSHFLKED